MNEPNFVTMTIPNQLPVFVEQWVFRVQHGLARSKANAHHARKPAVLGGSHAEMAPSFLWFAAIQCIESEQDLAGLALKDCFIPAKPVERVAGQIGETQEATREPVSRCSPASLSSSGDFETGSS